MKATLRAAVMTLFLPWTLVPCASTLAQISPEFSNSNIDIAYVPPRSLKYLPIYDRVQQFRMLEQLAEFLSPVKLPHKYTLTTLECGVVNAFYAPAQWRINLCYEYVEMLERIGPKKGQPSDFTYEEAVLGAFVAVILHENGHAAFDMLDVPVYGREEDAADEFSTFLALQFSPEVARKIVRGYSYKSKTYQSGYAPLYSDEHGAPLQRYYNTLCIAYGSEYSELFKEFVDKGELPKSRAADCKNEYEQIKAAFAKTVLPFIDQDKLKKVQARQWLTLTPQQVALLNQQQQQQTDNYIVSVCSHSAVTKISVAVVTEPVGSSQWQAMGWFQIPDGGCEVIGTFHGDHLYWYAEGIKDNKKVVWSAPQNDQTALKQCIQPNNGFQLAETARCQTGQALVNFWRRDVDPAFPDITLRLR
jgi:Putative metallopeptidase/Protein of unknown function (DUF1036)